jgi:hypothetical protein
MWSDQNGIPTEIFIPGLVEGCTYNLTVADYRGQIEPQTPAALTFTYNAPNLLPPAFTLSQSAISATIGSSISSYTISSTGGLISSHNYLFSYGSQCNSTRSHSHFLPNGHRWISFQPACSNSSHPVPDPVQLSKISSISSINLAAGSSVTVTVIGTFIEKISNIAVNNVLLPIGSWVQTPTSIAINLGSKAIGIDLIQIFDGSVPLLTRQTISVDAAVATPAPAATGKSSVVTALTCVRGKSVKTFKYANAKCPTGYVVRKK